MPAAPLPFVVMDPEFVIVFDAALALVASTWMASAFVPPVVIEPEFVTVLPPAFERPFAPKEIPYP